MEEEEEEEEPSHLHMKLTLVWLDTGKLIGVYEKGGGEAQMLLSGPGVC